ncbi:MAG: prepilin peptidase [Candidatus Omnitrophica bacterium]|nr:prepilin peptidase [Candidatus Omnitrophota bacterium]
MAYFVVFIFGAVIGSFLNVCIYRIPRGRSIVTPRSFCPNCEGPIAWYDNVPLLSFLVLGARCRSCRGRIPPKYFVVELITASLGTLLYYFFGFTPDFFVYWTMSCALIVISFIDIERREIPDVITLPGIAAGFVMVSVFALHGAPAVSAFRSLAGIFAGGASMFVLGYTGELIFKKDALGGGDIKLMAMIGAFLGWRLVLLTFFTAPILGSGVSVFMMIKKRRESIAYGPYLAGGAIVSLLFGDQILRYLFVY